MATPSSNQKETHLRRLAGLVGDHQSKILYLLLCCLGLAYLVAMFVAPWVISRGNWGHVQQVWDRWQGLNVGALALTASIVGLKAT
jgi:hypothetical protein